MTPKNSIWKYLFCIIIGFVAAIYIMPRKEISLREPYAIERIVTDTVIKIIKRKPIVINRVKTKIIYTRDTVIITKPFIASLDTILRQDTVSAKYQYPENLFSIAIRNRPDSIKVEQVTIIKTIEREQPWWEVPAYILSGVATGYLIGAAK